MTTSFLDIHLGPKDSPLVLRFAIMSFSLARKWLSQIEKDIAALPIEDPYRFQQFSDNDRVKLERELSKIIQLLNDYQHEVVPVSLHIPLEQSNLNELHVAFEKAIGSIDSPASFYKDAPVQIQEALIRYNVLIHLLEDYLHGRCPRFVVGFKGAERFPLESTDFSHFQLDRAFGLLTINYCEAGRQLREAFQAKDTHVSKENLRPMKYWSSNFRVDFFSTPKSFPKADFLSWVESQGFSPQDPRSALGAIAVGQLDPNHYSGKLPPSELIELVSQNQVVSSLRVIRGPA